MMPKACPRVSPEGGHELFRSNYASATIAFGSRIRGAEMYKVGIDVGGTFTDIVVQGVTGHIEHGKVPSIPGNESQAVLNALALMAERKAVVLQDFLAEVEVINFGTTVATNAMLQHRG